MKIYRTALNERIVTQVIDNAGERPFSKLFGKRSRILLPLKNNTILVIIKKLEEGETNTGTSYRVDLDNKVAYRYIIVDKEKKLEILKFILFLNNSIPLCLVFSMKLGVNTNGYYSTRIREYF